MPNSYLLWTTLRSKVVLLDLKTGTYSAITSCGAQKWQDQYGSNKLSVDRLLLPTRNLAFFKAPGLLQVLAVRSKVRSLIKSRDFFGMYNSAVNYINAPKCRSLDACDIKVQALIKNLKLTDVFFRTKDPTFDCLERSFTLAFALSMQKIKCWHRIGVSDIPFQAHAWVGIGDTPLIDRPEQLERFNLISNIEASN